MDAMEVLKTRRSIRQFKDKTISRKDIELMIDAARLAPSANNVQPWEFIVVTDVRMCRDIAAMADYGKFIADAPVCICVFCKETKYYLEDGSAATENIMLAARSLGIGSCWVAGDKKPYANRIGKMLNVPPVYKLVSMIAIGYPEDFGQAHGKRPLSNVIHWEKF